jgi:type IV secretory pathway TrbL component
MNKLKRYFEKSSEPKSAFGRWLNSFMLLLVFIGSFVAFYIIRFHLCGSIDCRELRITGIWYMFSPFFMLFGASALMLSIYISKEENLSSKISDAITISIVTAALLLLFIPSGISIEISSLVDGK